MTKKLRFFTDSHIDKQVAIQLRRRGVNIVRSQDVGMADASDRELLEYAIMEERAILTKDDDLVNLHFEWLFEGKIHHGIFFCPTRDRPLIGIIVTECTFYVEAIESGAGTLEDDIINQLIEIRE